MTFYPQKSASKALFILINWLIYIILKHLHQSEHNRSNRNIISIIGVDVLE